jgi:hypothetical protein
MHHHRLVLNGPPAAVARLADDLRAAGAVPVAPGDASSARLLWATQRPAAVEALCARHRSVIVGLERFETLGEELERLVLHGSEKTVLERRRVLPEAGEQHGHGDDDVPGLSLDDDAVPLDLVALHAAALSVAGVPVDLRPALAGSSLDDALLLGPSIGRLCVAAGDPLAHDPPPAAALDAIRALAALALTIGATCGAPACAAELDFERAWRLTRATVHASGEILCARPGESDWPEWLVHLLAGAAAVIESCAACLQQPEPPFASLHTEHFRTMDEQLDHAACQLVTAALQALVLFDRGSV